MSGPVVVLDACALIQIRLATTLLWLAEAGHFQPLWSEPILDEVQRNLPKVGVTPEQASRRAAMMRGAFGAEALIDGFDDLIDQMRCDPKDRHVLAAAVAGGAGTVATFNMKDLPDEAGAPYGIGIRHPDRFLIRLLGEHTDTVVATLERETAVFPNPPEAVPRFLATPTATAPVFANLAADAFRKRVRSRRPIVGTTRFLVSRRASFLNWGTGCDQPEDGRQLAATWGHVKIIIRCC